MDAVKKIPSYQASILAKNDLGRINPVSYTHLEPGTLSVRQEKGAGTKITENVRAV